MHRPRQSGLLLHPTSLPGPDGIGSMGKEARQFVDFLASAGQSVWQVLPLNPTAYGNSPYSCYSTFAGNPLLIDLRLLAEEGDLDAAYQAPAFPGDRVDFGAVEAHKLGLLKEAAAAFFSAGARERKEDFWRFCDTTPWLHDYALFMALKEHFCGNSWNDWPAEISLRTPEALAEWSGKLGTAIGEQKYQQWRFFRQWHALRDYASGKGVRVFGDIPIFVAFDSSDVWANPRLFKLDAKGKPLVVAGVPPDYFSDTGQLWGNPLYDWDEHERTEFRWWIDRVKASLDLYDIVRIDHFRGFSACWEVPAGETTAINGKWIPGPGVALFHALRNEVGELAIVAEDLGTITPDVEALREAFGFPGMKVLHFAFDSGPSNPYLPHNYVSNSVVYTGTHDNDTTVGWYDRLSSDVRRNVAEYLGYQPSEISWDLMRLAMMSVAETAVFPVQDVLSLGSEAKMNRPGTPFGNWSWRLREGALGEAQGARLLEMTEMYGRRRKEFLT